MLSFILNDGPKQFALAIVIATTGLSAPSSADPMLTIEGQCPGFVAITWEGATPDSWAMLVFSTEQGDIILPWGPCGGTRLDLGGSRVRVLPPRRTGPDGRGEFVGRTAPRACGGYLQMVVQDGQPCTTSNVVQIPE